MAFEDTFGTSMHSSFINFAGTSVGALFALICCLDIKIDEAIDLLDKIGLDEIFSKDFTWLISNYALNSGSTLRLLVTKLLDLKGHSSDLTLKELHIMTKKNLVITAVNIKTASVLYMNHVDYPDVSVISAIMGSMALPPLFPPVNIKINDKDILVADGALIDNFPISQFDPDTTLGIKSSWYIEPTNPMQDLSTYYTRILGILQLSLHFSQAKLSSKYSNILCIDLGPIKADSTDINTKEFILKGYRSSMIRFTNTNLKHQDIDPTKFL
jgi:hypothetical protein